MAWLLCLYLLAPSYFLRVDVSPRIQGSNMYGEAQKPLTVTVKMRAECRQIGFSIAGDTKSFVVQKDAPDDGRTLREEFRIVRGNYNIAVACLDGSGGILQLVDAGSAQVL
jgi:hypothetical protein